MFVWTREKKNANFHDEIHKDNSNSINENDNLMKVLTGKKSIDFFPSHTVYSNWMDLFKTRERERER